MVPRCPTARAEAPNLLRLPIRAARRLPDHADDKLTAVGTSIRYCRRIRRTGRKQNPCGEVRSSRGANVDRNRFLVLPISTIKRCAVRSYRLIVISPTLSRSGRLAEGRVPKDLKRWAKTFKHDKLVCSANGLREVKRRILAQLNQ